MPNVVPPPFAPSVTSSLDGWFGLEVTVPVRPDALTAAPTRRLFTWWREQATAGLPYWRDLTGAVLEDIGPFASVIVLRPEGRFEVQLVGEELAAMLAPVRGGSTGRPVDAIESRRRLHDHYRWIVRHRLPLHCTGPLAFMGHPDVQFEALDVPLAGDDGRVSHLVSVLVARP